MNPQPSIAAAQYLRMSTEEQQYSLENQAAAISEFARAGGFMIVKTYSDAAKSGLTLARRNGLRQLLSDVTSGHCEYRAILVYDVSRWGRFQDADESAHYEFLCKAGGVSVHYCAETFKNDGTLESTLMKALKRSMAGEFSRELGIRVHTGKRAIAAAGFSVGGRAPFGFRRKILSSDGSRCQILEAGERKYVRNERLTFVHGPAHEVACVREIFGNVNQERMTAREIARNLNSSGITLRGRRWTQELVRYIVTNPEYAGFSTWGRSSQRLGMPRANVSAQLWVLAPDSFPPIISRVDFETAQRLLHVESGRVFWTIKRVVDAAATIFRINGKLTLRLFDTTPGSPASSVVRQLGFPNICAAIGYRLPQRFYRASIGIKNALRIHLEVAKQIAQRFPSEISILPGPWPRLVLDHSINVSLLVCRRLDIGENLRWRIGPRRRDKDLITVVCLLDSSNRRLARIFIFPSIGFPRLRQIGIDDLWLNSGTQVLHENDLCSTIRTIASEIAANVQDHSSGDEKALSFDARV
jgi:DNA invertase Pin-like site-specific DNA recombinase